MKFLKLVLEGPLQSWGERGRWDRRDTAAMPTKSAVIGMLGCCLGYARGSDKLRALGENLHMAVRADSPGMPMTDFHTVQTDSGNFPNASGGTRPGNTIITPKQYLQDASFTVWLWGDERVLQECRDALRRPKWPLYLGRRNCVPSKPVLPEITEAASVDEAVCAGLKKDAAVEIEMLPGEAAGAHEHVVRRMDGVLNASRNEYRYRNVRASWLAAKEG